MTKQFAEAYNKGRQFEDAVLRFLLHETRNDWTKKVLTVEDVLPSGQYRVDGRQYPDFTIVNTSYTPLQLIEAKNKAGSFYRGIWQFTIEENDATDYISIADEFGCDIIVYFHHTKTKRVYEVDLKTDPFESVKFNNSYGTGWSRSYKVDEVKDVTNKFDKFLLL